MVLNLAMNYGGRAEITRAARTFAQEVAAGRRRPEDLTEAGFAQYLYTGGQPDPDLIIRPSGEERQSNFLLCRGLMRSLSTSIFSGRTLKPATWMRPFGSIPPASAALGACNSPLQPSRIFSRNDLP